MNILSDSGVTPTILVVDDAPDQTHVLQAILEEAGGRVITAAGGWEGLERARTAHPDLILLDLLMPNMDGREVLRALREDPRTQDVPVLFLTLLGGVDEIAEGLEAGARDYILKPFHTRELLARVRAHLEWKRSRDHERALLLQLHAARTEIGRLSRLLPFCLRCGRARDEEGFRREVAAFRASRPEAPSDLGPCPGCGAPGGTEGSGEAPAPGEAPSPRPAPRPAPLPEAPFLSLHGGAPRILLVDDDPVGLQTLIQFLRVDCKLMVATEGAEALETAAREQPDLILLDVVMEGMDGHQICRALKEDPLTRSIPVIFVTGKDREEDELAGLVLGAADYIAKPFSLPLVHRRIRTQLEHRRALDLLERQSMVDGLTGLANRSRLLAVLDLVWRQSVRLREPLSLIHMEMDHFQEFVDLHGPQAGDEGLGVLARCLDAVRRRSTDLVARTGGGAFLCLLPGMPLQGARELAEAMRGAVEALALPHGASRAAAHVTLSLGAACAVPSRGEAASSLLEEAERALRAAREGGGNRVAAPQRDLVPRTLSRPFLD